MATKKVKQILGYFPGHLQARPIQISALEKIEAAWNSSDVVVVNLPTGTGKSAISNTIMKWSGKAIILAPNKLLVNQYAEEYKTLHILRGKADHICTISGRTLDKRPRRIKSESLCSKLVSCEGCDKYREELRRARIFPHLLCNSYVYLAHRPRLYRETLIIDEAHKFIDALKMMYERKIWWGSLPGKLEFPTTLRTGEALRRWAADPVVDAKYRHNDAFHMLVQEIELNRHVISPKYDEDSDNYYIHLSPVDLRKFPPIGWPAGVKKIVLLSATISRKDLEQMGLGDRRITYINATSPVEAARRPVYFTRHVNMSMASQQANLEKLCEIIVDVARDPKHLKSRGLIHATYNLAPQIYTRLPEDVKSRVITHDRENKSRQYEKFRNNQDDNTILLASGMYEGIDLPYDACRWQIISKVPFPYLGDPAVKYLAEVDQTWYEWSTIKTVLQAAGRIVRSTDDFGETFILDTSFRRLYTNPRSRALFPQWFLDSIRETSDV